MRHYIVTKRVDMTHCVGYFMPQQGEASFRASCFAFYNLASSRGYVSREQKEKRGKTKTRDVPQWYPTPTSNLLTPRSTLFSLSKPVLRSFRSLSGLATTHLVQPRYPYLADYDIEYSRSRYLSAFLIQKEGRNVKKFNSNYPMR
jgi:hypothetical protein